MIKGAGRNCTLMALAARQGIALTHIKPGKLQENAYVERDNRTVRHEWLDLHIFETLMDVQTIARIYNTLYFSYTYVIRARAILNGGRMPIWQGISKCDSYM